MVSIAIDGPAGAGKSTIAKFIAKKTGFIYVDTGAMYRSLGLLCIRKNIDISNEKEVECAIKTAIVTINYIDGNQVIYLNNEDVSKEIRKEEVGNTSSKIATYKAVREKLLNLQQDIAKNNNVIMDGRDIGTTVLPNANLKIYLTASSDIRAKRRYKELEDKGIKSNLDLIKKDIEDRDYRDMNRDISPLTKANDAIIVDASNMTIEEVSDTIIDYIKK